jgi:hypothetical protein
MGFQDLPFDPHRAMIVRMVDLERSGNEQKTRSVPMKSRVKELTKNSGDGGMDRVGWRQGDCAVAARSPRAEEKGR